MNRFALVSDAAGLCDGLLGRLATHAAGTTRQRYTLADNFFHAAFGGSFLNHFWLVCACTPVYPNAPQRIVAQVDASGTMIADGAVTPDGFGVNTMEPVGGPHDAADRPRASCLPVQTMPTIGDRLSEKGVDWAWYSGGWNEARGRHGAGRHVQLPPPAVRVLRPVPEREARPRQAPQGPRRTSSPTSTAAACPPSPSTSRGAASTSTRARATWSRSDRHTGETPAAPGEEPAVAEDAGHRDLRRERRLLGPRRAAGARPMGAGHARPDDHRVARSRSRASSTTRPTTRRRSSGSSRSASTWRRSPRPTPGRTPC